MGITFILVGLFFILGGLSLFFSKQNKDKLPTSKKVIVLILGMILLISGSVITNNQHVAEQKRIAATPTSTKAALPILTVLAESNVNKLSSLDGAKVGMDDIESIVYQGARKDKKTGEIYHHVYYLMGKFRYQGKQIPFSMTFSFDRNDITSDNAKYQVITYSNSVFPIGTIIPDLTANTPGGR